MIQTNCLLPVHLLVNGDDVTSTNLPNFLKEETTFFIPCFILLKYALLYLQLARIQY